MTVDYDLIILGGAPVGRYAALRACNLGARVALIEPAVSTSALPDCLSQVNRLFQSQLWLEQFAASPPSAPPDWSQLRGWSERILQRLTASVAMSDSLPHLMTAGVEVILSEATFQQPNPRLRLGLAVEQRLLRARAYLLAPAAVAMPPEIPGLTQMPVWTDWPKLPQQLVIWGGDADGVWLAQVLNRLGAQVSLICEGSLLPQVDPDVERLLQLQLEAEGVTVLTQTLVKQVRHDAPQIWVQLGSRAIQTEAVLLAHSQLALESLNLEIVGVKWQPDQILVNRRLQTSQPRIYACNTGDLGEADVALHNALGFPAKSFLPQPIWSLPTDPEVLRLGLTEPQAIQRYGTGVRIGSQPLKQLASAQMRGETTGFVKLIAHANGKILGAHAVGRGASDWMGEVALAMQHNLTLNALATGSALSPMSHLIRQIAAQIQAEQRPNWQRELLETWFDFRRSR